MTRSRVGRLVAPLFAVCFAAGLTLGPAAPASAEPKDDKAAKSASAPGHQRQTPSAQSDPSSRGPRGQSTSSRGDSPPGNNGHIHSSVSGCTITVTFHGFDGGLNQVRVIGSEKPPTGDGAVLISDSFTQTFRTRTHGNTLQATRTYTLAGTHHLKIVASVTGPNGRTARKSKVEWVRCGSAAAAAASATTTTVAAASVSATASASVGASASAGRSVGSAARSAMRRFSATLARPAAARAVGAADEAAVPAEVLGTTFERALGADTPARAGFAFTGAEILRLLAAAAAALIGGGLMARAKARRRAVMP